MFKLFAKLSLFLTLISFIFIIIGIATSSWSQQDGTHTGLWNKGSASWVLSVRVLIIIPIFGAVFNLILLCMYIRKEDGRTNLTRIRLAILFTLLSAILCITGVIVYAAKKTSEPHFTNVRCGWSFVLTSTGGGLMALILLSLAAEIKQSQVMGSYESI